MNGSNRDIRNEKRKTSYSATEYLKGDRGSLMFFETIEIESMANVVIASSSVLGDIFLQKFSMLFWSWNRYNQLASNHDTIQWLQKEMKFQT